MAIRKLITKTYIKWLTWIPHYHHAYPHARHTSCVLKSEIFNPTITKPQREKIRFITTRIERAETPYDPTILTKLVIRQDCAKSRTRERERDQTHSYWYIPSAPRVNYSCLIMEAAGMMKMAFSDDFPPPAGCRNGAPDGIASEQRLAAAEKLI